MIESYASNPMWIIIGFLGAFFGFYSNLLAIYEFLKKRDSLYSAFLSFSVLIITVTTAVLGYLQNGIDDAIFSLMMLYMFFFYPLIFSFAKNRHSLPLNYYVISLFLSVCYPMIVYATHVCLSGAAFFVLKWLGFNVFFTDFFTRDSYFLSFFFVLIPLMILSFLHSRKFKEAHLKYMNLD